MITCQEIIDRAHAKIGIRNPSAQMSNAALWALEGMMTGMLHEGVFGRVRDAYAIDDHTGQENIRVIASADDALTITWPDTYEYDVGDTIPDDDGLDTENRPPRDLAVFSVADGEETVTYIYDSYLGRHVRLDGLSLSGECPLAQRDREGLACMLAIDLSADFPGSILTPQTVERARRFRGAISNPPSQQAVIPTYY